jgi:hypothetical protein
MVGARRVRVARILHCAFASDIFCSRSLSTALSRHDEDGFCGFEKQRVARAAREEVDGRIGLPPVGFKTQLYPTVSRARTLSVGRRRSG